MSMSMQPTWTHYCEACSYLGTVRLNQRYDVYRCKGSSAVLGDTILARYGNEPSEYASMDAAVICYSILAPRDDIQVTPAIRAMLIGVLVGNYPTERS